MLYSIVKTTQYERQAAMRVRSSYRILIKKLLGKRILVRANREGNGGPMEHKDGSYWASFWGLEVDEITRGSCPMAGFDISGDKNLSFVSTTTVVVWNNCRYCQSCRNTCISIWFWYWVTLDVWVCFCISPMNSRNGIFKSWMFELSAAKMFSSELTIILFACQVKICCCDHQNSDRQHPISVYGYMGTQ